MKTPGTVRFVKQGMDTYAHHSIAAEAVGYSSSHITALAAKNAIRSLRADGGRLFVHMDDLRAYRNRPAARDTLLIQGEKYLATRTARARFRLTYYDIYNAIRRRYVRAERVQTSLFVHEAQLLRLLSRKGLVNRAS